MNRQTPKNFGVFLRENPTEANVKDAWLQRAFCRFFEKINKRNLYQKCPN